MSEQGNCFPFLRKANGPERALGAPQFRRLARKRGRGDGERERGDARTPVARAAILRVPLRERAISFRVAIDLSAKFRRGPRTARNVADPDARDRDESRVSARRSCANVSREAASIR